MVVLPVYVDHDKNGSSPRFDGDGAKGLPSLLSGFIHPVQPEQTTLILKDQRGKLE